MLRRRSGWLVALVAALTVAACSGDADTTTTEAVETPTTESMDTTEPESDDGGGDTTTTAATDDLVPEADVLRVVIDTQPDFGNAGRYYWLELLEERLGEHGVTVEEVILEGSDSALRAIVAGQGDLNIGSLGAAVRLIGETGEGVKVLAADAGRTTYIMLAREGVESLEDLVGGTIGIRAPGDAGDVVTRATLTASGFDLEDVDFIEVGGTSARLAALTTGQIDLGAAHIAEATVAMSNAPLNPLIVAADVMPPWIQSGVVATDVWLESHPNMAQIVVDALMDMNRWAIDNPEEFAEYTKLALPEEEMGDEARLDAVEELIRIGYFPENGGIDQETLESFLEVEVNTGGLEEGQVPPIDEWVDRSFLDNYLERSGTR